ncbi:hypothetical protein CROQUDRAFT_701925 [Cronartium quercuum f. sp. fusiforme G11]|uniref:CCHC-type domain-containing protein n=1 Tax=Cronartium quercuum f. sp. fusiforme G11 TaxID=708437 RepID=A0A9P6NME1_9BASI|nr:hypothetical protein CROQUDRAFT_701925 [Cronartium quercuum f. sp. fusiforme G11]
MEYSNELEKIFDRLESEGVAWTRDCLLGIFLQLGAPTSGPYAMEEINLALDRKYRDDPAPFGFRQIRTEMQSLVGNKRLLMGGDDTVNVMATMSLDDKRTMTKKYHTGGTYRTSQPPSVQARAPITPTTSERDASEMDPIAIPTGAAPKVRRGENQCFQCGGFGHFRTSCQQRTRKAPHWNDWRFVRIKDNICRLYSLDVLGIRPTTRPQHTAQRGPRVKSAFMEEEPTTIERVAATNVVWSSEDNAEDECETEYLLDATVDADSGNRG